MTNEERVQIFAAYWGAQVKVNGYYNSDSTPKEIVANITNIGLMTLGTERGQYPYNDCQLLLTDLSLISDEHAVNVCKFLYSNPALHNPLRGKVVATVGDWHSTRKGVEIIDYLRSKGYNIGYGKYTAQDLVNEGVVIIDTKNKGI